MHLIDWIVLASYLIISLCLGLYLARRNRTEDDYFVAGRKLTGWLAGASMAATTFSIDTPLYIAGLVGTRGLSANWEWWSFGIAHVAMTIIFAPLWRRSGVLTDASFIELRYGGKTAAWLRAVKAFLLALPINCIGIGYAFLALKKVAEALELVNGNRVIFGVSDTFLLLMVVALFMLSYTVIGGLWAVVINDFFQLVLALLGAFMLAYFVLKSLGGMDALLSQIQQLNRPELLSLFPWEFHGNGINWIDGTGISLASFSAYISLQWWSFRRSDGGGEFIQRMLATRNEKEAERAGWVFLIVNYLLRSWIWIVVALSALILLPSQQDWELSYPILAVKYLPPFFLGLVIVSLVAAFMSTVSTSLNWGASYLTYDLYKRFLRPSAGNRELLFIAQIASIVLLLFGVLTALFSNNIGSIFRLVIAIGTGPGVVLVLRWFWWRINAAAELSAMVCGFLIGLSTSIVPILRIEDYGLRLILNTALTGIVWLTVLVLTPPESKQTLENFVKKVRPPGPGWKSLRGQLNVIPVEDLDSLIKRFLLGVGILFGILLGSGCFLLQQERGGWIGFLLAGSCYIAMQKNNSKSRAFG